nr:hypothetical protein [uncultured Emticicia sp.]
MKNSVINKYFVYGFLTFFCLKTAVAQKYKPISFTRQPILLLKFTPLPLFATENAFQIGAELAPPIGRFSFNFDYGTGKGKLNVDKYIRKNMPDMKTQFYRGEIRGYFSDWYPFYALDRKPFGRYWALEYAQKKINRQEVNAVAIGAASLPNYAIFEKTDVLQTEQILNIKWGKNFLIHRHFFIDAYIGAGVRKYKVSSDNDLILHSGFISKWKFWEVGSKGFLPNATAGFRLCLVI